MTELQTLIETYVSPGPARDAIVTDVGAGAYAGRPNDLGNDLLALGVVDGIAGERFIDDVKGDRWVGEGT